MLSETSVPSQNSISGGLDGRATLTRSGRIPFSAFAMTASTLILTASGMGQSPAPEPVQTSVSHGQFAMVVEEDSFEVSGLNVPTSPYLQELRDRYRRMSSEPWFLAAHEGKSLGEDIRVL